MTRDQHRADAGAWPSKIANYCGKSEGLDEALANFVNTRRPRTRIVAHRFKP
jgi:hypothetical protein